MKTLWLSVSSLLLMQSAWAGYVTPNVERNRKTLNKTPNAVAWSQRNGVGLEVTKYMGDTKVGGQRYAEYDGLELGPYAMLRYQNLSVEVQVDYEKNKNDLVSGTDSDQKNLIPNIYAGFEFNPSFAAGVEVSRSTEETKTSASTEKKTTTIFGPALTAKLMDFIYLGAGAQLIQGKLDATGGVTYPEINYNRFYFSLGYQDYDLETREGMSAEFTYANRSREYATNGSRTLVVGEKSEYIFEGLYAFDMYQIHGDLNYAKSEDYFKTKTLDDFTATAGLELLFEMGAYFTPMFSYVHNKEQTIAGTLTTDVKTSYYGFILGYRQPQYDGSLKILKTDQTQKLSTSLFQESTNGWDLSLNGAFFF